MRIENKNVVAKTDDCVVSMLVFKTAFVIRKKTWTRKWRQKTDVKKLVRNPQYCHRWFFQFVLQGVIVTSTIYTRRRVYIQLRLSRQLEGPLALVVVAVALVDEVSAAVLPVLYSKGPI